MDRQPETIKQIPAAALRPGMFLHELPCGWLDHPFLRNRFLIPDEATVAVIRRTGADHVLIDTARGLDVAPAPPAEAPSAPAPRTGAPPVVIERRTPPVLETWRDTVSTVEGIMTAARAGRPPDGAAVRGVVGDLREVISQQPSALYGLTHLRSKDRYTFEHCVAVAMFSVAFAHALELPDEEVLEIGTGALLHDFGKVHTPERILNKPGRLTTDEYKVMQRHVEHTRTILDGLSLSSTAYSAAADHHERLDGSGYPRRCAGDAIGVAPRLVAICDVYDAMTADRVYRRGIPPTQVLRSLLEGAGSQFDASLVHRFIRFVGIYPPGALVRLASDRLAVVLAHGEGLLFPRVRVIYDARRRRSLTGQPDVALDPAGDERITASEDPAVWGYDPAALARIAVDLTGR